MNPYDFKATEAKWKKLWEPMSLYKTTDDFSKKKHYVLDMFPYPSGEGLHLGHTRIYTTSDIYTRMKRMEGYNVLHPTGWDAFGLPAEQYAIKNKIHPRVSTDTNINNYRRQMKMLDLSYDFDREVDTTDPEFYKWTQWAFLKMYEKGLAFETFSPINWCPSCQTGLANEDLEAGKCERCGSVVEKKPMRQWVLRITNYADRLINDLETLPQWPEWIKELQRNWIGRSEGAEFDFKLDDVPVQDDLYEQSGGKHSVRIFTTRADTLFGATFVAISAELAKSWIDSGFNMSGEVVDYVNKTIEEQKVVENDYTKEIEKTGVFTGVYAINPANEEKIPVWVANYVLGGVGTGAIMAVPAHDERDKDFAEKFNLPIKDTSLDFSKEEMISKFGGTKTIRYKLQDWVFSRQRYWGEPIPMVHDRDSKAWPLDESELPLVLPEVENYEPSGTGESPLATIDEWVNVKGYITDKGTFKQSTDGEVFRRETNTMPQWAGSSWYYLRFADTNNKDALISDELEKYWQPVDVYVGGAEHATRHLIYARFWHKFLYDIGVVKNIEPFTRMESVGLVLAKGGVKMSKRLGNIINPDDVVNDWGTDVVRMYVAFMGSFYDATAFDEKQMMGVKRFLERVWKAQSFVSDNETGKELLKVIHQTIKKVTEDIAVFKFNTGVSQLMICLNVIEKEKSINRNEWKQFIQLLAPYATTITEELWGILGEKDSIHISKWPVFNEELVTEDEVTISLQIGGKLRGTFVVPFGSTDDFVTNEAKKTDGYKKYVGENEPKKVIVIPNRLVNIVI